VPYIEMTLSLLNKIGVVTSFEKKIIRVHHKSKIVKHQLLVESDWSSASYYYSIVALSEVGTEINLFSYKQDSLQGDSVVSKIYNEFGVQTSFENNSISIKKSSNINYQSSIKLDLSNTPDIAQTIAITCFALGIECFLSGLHTLKIKETDRILALKIEIEKLGGKVLITEDSLRVLASNSIKENIKIETYKDHRMAMAFAPLALKVPVIINEASVVSKSYPNFWSDLKSIGFKIQN